MKKKRYTHLFFDLDNTLWDFKKNSHCALSLVFNFYKLSKQNIDFNQFFKVYSAINKSLWEDYREKRITKKNLIEIRFQKTFDELKIVGIDACKFNQQYLEEMPKQKTLIEGAASLLQYMKEKGYKMQIITNGFKEVQQKKLKVTQIDNYFSKVFVSEVIEAPKPDAKIFEYALKSSNAPKKSSLMIGDNWKSDIEGAINFGIDSVFYNPHDFDCKNARMKYSKSNVNIYSIKNLTELINML